MTLVASPESHAAHYPPILDWRNNNGNFVTPIKDQGDCGSCWAFATTAAIESSTLIYEREPGGLIDLSEQVLVSCVSMGNCDGGYINVAADFMVSTGLPPESYYPYTATDGTCSSAQLGWQSHTEKIAQWVWASNSAPTVEILKAALNQYGPLVTTMEAYEEFFSYSSGIYQHVGVTRDVGNHAVLLVGYNDNEQSFMVKNSWGPTWGENGYFRIAYSELSSPTAFGHWSIAYINPSNPTQTCAFSISPTSASSHYDGITGNITVSASATGCGWTASSNAQWLAITSGASGTGKGSVYYSVAPNTGTVARTATITVAGQSFTLTQDGQTCSYTAIQALSPQASTGKIRVGCAGNCSWNATSNVPWIIVTGTASGTGDATVQYAVLPNTTFERTGILTVAGQQFALLQEAGTCIYTVSPTALSAPYNGGATAFTIAPSGSACPWNATSNVSWVTLTSGQSGTGPGTVAVSVTPNSTSAERTGTINVAGQAIAITQTAPPGSAYSLTLVIAGTGSGAIIANGITYTANTSLLFPSDTIVTLQYSAVRGTNLVGWSGGGCLGNGVCRIRMNTDKTITATFAGK